MDFVFWFFLIRATVIKIFVKNRFYIVRPWVFIRPHFSCELWYDKTIKKTMKYLLDIYSISLDILLVAARCSERKVPFWHFRRRRFYVAKKRSGSQLARKFLQRANDEEKLGQCRKQKNRPSWLLSMKLPQYVGQFEQCRTMWDNVGQSSMKEEK